MTHPWPHKTDPAQPTSNAFWVCADDYAHSEATSAAIVELLNRKRINATSVMSLSPEWALHARNLKQAWQNWPVISVGLHLDWTSDFALAAGHGRPLTRLMLNTALGQMSVAQALIVVHRQLDAFEDHWGQPPSHLDGHQHVHQFAGIRHAVVQALKARYRQNWPRLRISNVPATAHTAGLDRLKAWAINTWGASQMHKLARAANQPVWAPLLGVYNFDTTPGLFAQRLNQWLSLASQSPNAVLMVHPANSPPPNDVIGLARVKEWLFLNSPDWPTLMQAHALVLAGAD